MDKYYINIAPISIRVAPAAMAKIINVYKPNTVIRTVEERNGWFKTISGTYILKSQYLEPLEKYNKRMIRDGRKDKIIYLAVPKNSTFVMSSRSVQPRATIDEIKAGTVAEIGQGIKDINGTVIPSSEGNQDIIYSVVANSVDKEAGTCKIKSASGQEYTVNVSDIKIMDTEGNIQEVDQEAQQIHQQQIDRIVSDIENIESFTIDGIKNFANLNVTNIRSVFGMPYQFTPIVDARWDGTMNDSAFGRKYAEKIVSRMPMMIMQAGIPEFLQGYNDQDKKVISTAIMSKLGIGSNDDKDLQNVVNQAGKYYALKITSQDYYNAVTPMCRAVAMLLGLGDVEVTINGYKDKLSNFQWDRISIDPVWGYYQGAVSFYINSDAQIQESFSNSTTQSQLAGKVNQLGAIGQEVQFLLGGITNTTGFDLVSYGKDHVGPDAKVDLNMASNNSIMGVVDNMIANVKTLISGGKMIFPEIWSDSQFMRSYQVTIKLDSPDCDNLSIYLNILVPLCHILGFVQPRRIGANTYISPYLCRAYYKSMFHIDMGIITECNIVKGDVGAWNQNGIPTQVTINLTIKDLYNVLSMALGSGNNDLIGNPAQLDYLANLCGVNIGVPDTIRTLKLWWLIRGYNRVDDNLHSAWVGAINEVYRRWHNLTSLGDFTM